MMAAATASTSLVPVQPVFTESERLALAAFLAGYRGLTREAYTLDLRQFTGWCRARSVPLFSVRRADIETFARELEASGRARATVTRRLCTIAGFYKYAVEEELLDHSPAAHVRRPRLDYESHATALDRNELGGLLVAAGLGPPAEHALISLLALNGLRVSEATGADIVHLGLERGHRTLVITRKGGKVVTIPLAPRTARAIDLAIGERTEGPLFVTADGKRLDRHGAARIVRRVTRRVTWRMQPQQSAEANGITSLPDYLFIRTNGPPAKIAVFLDGYAYHGAPGHSRTAEDARQRGALRDAGYLVWNLTWDDLDGFERLLNGDEDTFRLVDTTTQNKIRQIATGLTGMVTATTGGNCSIQDSWQNPVGFLTAYLGEPYSDIWTIAASVAAQTLFVPPPQPTCLEPGELAGALAGVLTGERPESTGGPLALTYRHREMGCSLAVIADTRSLETTLGILAVLDDRPDAVGAPGHRERWADWLHWANLAQFLRGADRSALFVTTAMSWAPALHPLAAPPPRVGAMPVAAGQAPDKELDASWQLVAEYTADSVLPLLRQLTVTGLPRPEPGYEIGDRAVQVELAWPDDKIALILDAEPDRDGYLTEHGWHLVRPGDGAFEEITEALGRWRP